MERGAMIVQSARSEWLFSFTAGVPRSELGAT
jgi:hypothetical protein